MTDAPTENQNTQNAAAGLPVTVLSQYVKDLSFENPNAPLTLRHSDDRPVMDASFSMDARRLEWEGRDFVYEVTLGIRTIAQKGDKAAFVCELEYGILCELRGVPEDQHHPLLLIEMPRLAFPFVRQIVATLTQQAGYMPLLLAPVDFRALYIQQFGEEMRKQMEQQQGQAEKTNGSAA